TPRIPPCGRPHFQNTNGSVSAAPGRVAAEVGFRSGSPAGRLPQEVRKMTKSLLAAAIAATAFAAPALAHDDPALEARVARVEQQLEQRSAPSAREIQSS